jgi:hypothetical protein
MRINSWLIISTLIYREYRLIDSISVSSPSAANFSCSFSPTSDANIDKTRLPVRVNIFFKPNIYSNFNLV